MKLCRFKTDNNARVGIETDAGIADLTAQGFPASLEGIIEGGNTVLDAIADAMRMKTPPLHDFESVTYLPVTEPNKILCVGLNYASHAAETGSPAPEHPVFFSKFNDALSAAGQPVALPAWHNCYDYEAELVIVVGKTAYNISADDAENYIFGYTCGNDLSARDAQFLSSQWLTGKSLPGFAPAGPFVVTKDGFDPRESHSVSCEVNGKTVQSGNTSDMIFNCFELLSSASRFFPLNPGDLIFTGTPSGVIMGKPEADRVWLRPGDEVKVSIGGIGTLRTPLL